MERRLVVILAMDVVGYSAQMRKDEEGTLNCLMAARQVIDKQIGLFGGRIFGSAGDSVLAEFTSPVEAVRCGIDIQTRMDEERESHPEAGCRLWRIGVNLGDVIADGDNLFGDGVNVAARLESLCEPAGLCVSDAVYEQVRDRLDTPFMDIGEQAVKNIERPIRTWAWTLGGLAGPSTPDTTDDTRPAPAIAVLPFQNLSGDQEQEYLADGIAEEIITTLSKVPGFLVVARNSTFSYKGQSVDIRQVGVELGADHVLEGSVRVAGNRVRISAQLVDSKTGHHLWADRFDRNIEDIFELQDEISLKVATALQGELLEGEMARLRGAGTRNVEAWVQHMRAIGTMRQVTSETNLQARRFAEEATRLDPEYSAAICTIGMCHAMDARHGFSTDRDASIELAREFANRAIELDPQNCEAYGLLGFANNLDGQIEQAIDKFRKALDINPNHAELNIRLALTLVFNGQPEEAVRASEKARRICPKYPPWFAGVYGFALRVCGRYDEAIRAFEEYGRRVEGFGLVDLTIVYVMMGDLETARQKAREVLHYRPDFTVSDWARTQLYNSEDGPRADIEALLKAGLPA